MNFLSIKRNKIIGSFVVVIFAFSIILPTKVYAASSIAYSGSDVTGEVFDVIPLTGITVSGDDPTVPVNLSVDGDGILSMTTTTGLTFTGSSTGSNISFEGSITDVNNALATLQYRSDKAETVTLTATLANAGEVYFPGNGHMYEIVDNGGGISWNDAKIAAEALTKNGAEGYLATVTSQAEFDYISPRLSGAGWFGASDATTEGDWQWATGPETGTSFWSGLGDGSPVGGLFSNWSSGEPNDSGGDEDCAEFYSGGSGWNDLPCGGPYLDYYVVEYGTDGNLPTAPSSIDFQITTTEPAAQNVTISSCLDVFDLSTNQADHRFDNISLTTDIDCTGETMTPLFNDTDPDFGTLGFRGTFNGNGHTISNYNIPQDGSSSVGFMAKSDGASISNITFSSGTVTGDGCTGAIVGEAVDTDFNNVHSNLDVEGNNSVGGLVGCYYNEDRNSSFVSSGSSGDITGDGTLGGIIGYFDAQNEHDFSLSANEFSGTLSTPGAWLYYVGGLIGEGYTEDGAAITVNDNISAAVSPNGNSYYVGGLIGYFEAYSDSDANFYGNSLTGDISAYGTVGGLFGYIDCYDASVINIYDTVLSDITVTASNDGYAGGIAGEIYSEGYNDNDGTSVNMYDLNINADVVGTYEIGGVAGEVYTDNDTDVISVENSFVEGDVTGDDQSIGGIFGYSSGGSLDSVFFNGNVYNNGNGYDTGGLVGYADNTNIAQSSSEGTVTSLGGQRIGGLVGRNAYSNISESYSMSEVTASDSSRVGGLVGANGSEGIIENSYARGNVTGDDNVGGLVGRCGGKIYSSYATGLVSGNTDVGGLVGYEDGCDSTDSFWDAQTTGQSTSEIGTTKTTSEMKSVATFTDTDSAGLDNPWDFDDIWGINSIVNDGYPCLQWQDGDCAYDSSDSDGIDNNIEAAAPNSGDANNDGTPDNQQANVASFVNPITNEYASIEVSDDCELTTATSQGEESNSVKDSGFDYSSGLLNFTADCGTPGYTANVKLFIYGVTDFSQVLRKHNPNTNAYFTIDSAIIEQSVVGSQNVTIVSYQITDGQDLDTDSLVNGIIVDPVGLAKAVVGSPNTGFGGFRQ